jgi:hypothetical protein
MEYQEKIKHLNALINEVLNFKEEFDSNFEFLKKKIDHLKKFLNNEESFMEMETLLRDILRTKYTTVSYLDDLNRRIRNLSNFLEYHKIKSQ